MSNWAIIVAAGSSVRFGGSVPKQFRVVHGRPLLSWTLSRFESATAIDSIIIVGHPDELSRISSEVVDPFDFSKIRKIVAGGDIRQESVLRGLEALPKSPGLVAIHDGARPMTSPADINRVVESANSNGAAILAIRATDTIKAVHDSFVDSTLDRKSLYYAQTPQVFRSDIIVAAHQSQSETSGITDDAMLVERSGVPVIVVEAADVNLKVTTEDDLLMVEALLKKETDG